jgi:hypothetical protein
MNILAKKAAPTDRNRYRRWAQVIVFAFGRERRRVRATARRS